MGLLDEYTNKIARALMDSGTPVTTGEKMDNMSWDDLYDMRLDNRGKQGAQENIAPYEHQAWAREQGKKGFVQPLVTGFVMNPAYQAAKATGLSKYLSAPDDMTTDASMAELVGGMRGGLLGARDWVNSFIPKVSK